MFKRMLAAAAVIAAGGGLLIWTGAQGASADETVREDTAPPPAEVVEALRVVDDCHSEQAFAVAADRNKASIQTLSFAPFGRGERGWETYLPAIAQEIGAACAHDTPGFARDLAAWQGANGLDADGVMGPVAFQAMKSRWQNARPYVAVRASGVCPAPPSDAELVTLSEVEGYKGKRVQLRSDVAEAYRQMVAAAKHEAPEILQNPEALQVYSGYRSPAYDDARCARDGNCGGIVRASCSSHRTGMTFDLVITPRPGGRVDSTEDANRLAMSQSPEYLWMVENAARFGFVNYVFEPWHWEFVGDDADAVLARLMAD